MKNLNAEVLRIVIYSVSLIYESFRIAIFHALIDFIFLNLSYMYEISLIGFVPALFAIFLFAFKKPRLNSNIVLAVWLFVVSFQMMADILFIRTRHFMGLDSVGGILQLTYGPLLYIYAKTLLTPNQVFKKFYYIHFAPFFGALLYVLLIQLHRANDFGIPEMLASGKPPKDVIIFGLAITLSMMIYLVLIKKLLRHRASMVAQGYLPGGAEIGLTWLNTTVLIFASIIILDNLWNILDIIYHKSLFNPEIIIKSGSILAVYSLIYFASKNSNIVKLELNGSDDNNSIYGEEAPSGIESLTKYKRSGLKPEEMDSVLQTLQDYMEDEKPYLKRDLTIYDLAQETDIPKHYITQVINEKLNKNFYTFVNEYRISEFKQRLADPENARFTIMSIAFESGFNSKAAFNTIFKKVENVTPSEYRNLCLNNKLEQ